MLTAFEALFYIRTLPTEGDEKRPVIFLEDQGECSYLADQSKFSKPEDLIRGLFANLRVVFHYQKDPRYQVFQYRTRAGAEVPLCFRFEGREIGIIALPSEDAANQAFGSANSFLRKYKNGRILLVHDGQLYKAVSDRILILPAFLLV